MNDTHNHHKTVRLRKKPDKKYSICMKFFKDANWHMVGEMSDGQEQEGGMPRGCEEGCS